MIYNTSEKIELLKKSFIKSINDSELTVDIIYYVLKDILNEVSVYTQEYNKEVNRSLIEKQQRQMQDESKTDIVEGE